MLHCLSQHCWLEKRPKHLDASQHRAATAAPQHGTHTHIQQHAFIGSMLSATRFIQLLSQHTQHTPWCCTLAASMRGSCLTVTLLYQSAMQHMHASCAEHSITSTNTSTTSTASHVQHERAHRRTQETTPPKESAATNLAVCVVEDPFTFGWKFK